MGAWGKRRNGRQVNFVWKGEMKLSLDSEPLGHFLPTMTTHCVLHRDRLSILLLFIAVSLLVYFPLPGPLFPTPRKPISTHPAHTCSQPELSKLNEICEPSVSYDLPPNFDYDSASPAATSKFKVPLPSTILLPFPPSLPCI